MTSSTPSTTNAADWFSSHPVVDDQRHSVFASFSPARLAGTLVAASSPAAAAAASFKPSLASPTAATEGFPCIVEPSLSADGQRLDVVLRACYTLADGELPNAMLQNWARRRFLRVRAAGSQKLAHTDCNYRLAAGDAVCIHHSLLPQLVKRRAPAAAPSADPSSWFRGSMIRHLDARMVIVSKPAGVPTQGGTSIQRGASVDDALPAIAAEVGRRWGAAGRGGGSGSAARHHPLEDSRLRLVHRLDMEVSGLLILARGRDAAASLTNGFKHGSISKTYVAIVGAALPRGTPSTGLLTAPVVHLEFEDRPAARGAAPRRTPGSTLAPTLSSEPATTAYTAHVLERRSAAAAPGSGGGVVAGGGAARGPGAEVESVTLLFLEPHTGRKHQLRQHVLHLFAGTAGILGDSKYSAKAVSSAASRASYGLPPPISARASPADAALAVEVPPWPPALGRIEGVRRRLMLHSLKVAVPDAETMAAAAATAAENRRLRENGCAPLEVAEGEQGGGSGGAARMVRIKDPMPREMAALLAAYGWEPARGD